MNKKLQKFTEIVLKILTYLAFVLLIIVLSMTILHYMC